MALVAASSSSPAPLHADTAAAAAAAAAAATAAAAGPGGVARGRAEYVQEQRLKQAQPRRHSDGGGRHEWGCGELR